MDVTSFIVSSRETALLDGDYGTYRAQLSRKLLNSRKKLGITSKNRGKYHGKGMITAEQVAEDHEHLRLQLLTAERAWAHAMAMKSAHATDNKGISAQTRSHIVSRLDKGARTAEALADVLAEAGADVASSTDVLEARAYACLLRGAAQFEKQSWQPSLRSYATARVIYGALGPAAKRDVFTDLVTETIDPSIRYAAYRLKIPRTQPIPSIARQAFPTSDAALVGALRELNPNVLEEGDQGSEKDARTAPQTLTWRSREVRIEDAAISVAWSSVQAAKLRLKDKLAPADMQPRDMAAAYDELLTASQDAVDATRQAIEDLRGEGVSQGDPRMQSLQITRTAVNYEAISWRIGRNRVLIGEKDGATTQGLASKKKRSTKKQAAQEDIAHESLRRRLAKVKEKVVLYDGTLQSIESIRELPGVAADEGLTTQLDATHHYLEALKCLALASSNAWVGMTANALALAQHASNQCEAALPVLSKVLEDVSKAPPNIVVSKAQAAFLQEFLRGEVQRYRALVDISNLQPRVESTARAQGRPLAETLAEYPSEGVNLDNIVVYPPRLEPIPVKPLFLDVAWNYIAYPTKDGAVRSQGQPAEKEGEASEAKQPQKRGWFGFGR